MPISTGEHLPASQRRPEAELRASSRLAAVGALLVVVVIWGSTFVATKLLFSQIGPSAMALLRFVVASIILVPLADWRSSGHLPWGRLALLGLTGVTSYFFFQNVALVYTSATDASLIIACLPALVAGLAALFLGERLTASRVVGVAISIVGVVVVVALGAPEPTALAPLLGNALMLGAAVSWAAYTTIGKGLESLSFRVTSAASVLFGALFLIPFAAAEVALQGWPRLTVDGWLGILYLGAGASALAYFLWNFALPRLDASEAAVYLNLVPLIGVLLAAATLQESVGLVRVAGGALIVGGVTLASQAPRRGAARRVPELVEA